MFKSLALLLVCCAALSASNPAAGVPWRWTPKHPTVTPNVNAIPYKKLMKSYVPKVRVPGTKAVEGCGPVPSLDRIVGGNEATPHSYPWMAALFIDLFTFCGGAIISEEWVLTAAHCMDGARTVDVVLGAHNIQENEASQVTLTSTDFFVHEDYGSILIKNDIALIRLPSAVTWTDEIKPICLPAYSDAELVDGDLVNPSGWGLASDDSTSVSPTLNEVTVPVLDNDICGEYYGASVTDDVICIDSAGGKGTCSGDSGGPLNYVDGGKTVSRGIVSYGSSTGCETGYPDAFTRVLNYLDWIETNTGIAIDP